MNKNIIITNDLFLIKNEFYISIYENEVYLFTLNNNYPIKQLFIDNQRCRLYILDDYSGITYGKTIRFYSNPHISLCTKLTEYDVPDFDISDIFFDKLILFLKNCPIRIRTLEYDP